MADGRENAMKVLWLCNIVLPKIAEDLSRPASNAGGWLVGFSEALLKRGDMELCIAFPLIGEKNGKEGTAGRLRYFGFPVKRNGFDRYNPAHERYFESIIDRIKPDILHIFGTELPSSLAMVNACRHTGNLSRLVINIQGLVSICEKHYYAGLPEKVTRKYTLFDFLLRNNIRQQKRRFGKRALFETETLQNARHVIGRTDWDTACVTQINPEISYHFCNEILRDSFYHAQWQWDACEKHSILMSQANYPIKGLHFLLEAMPLILKQYPDARITVAGLPMLADDWKSRLKRTSYAQYLDRLIGKYQLRDHVTFVGNLAEKDMCQRYVKTHVFVSPSVIENSPNSVGEAMMAGVPTVSSDVGGVKNMLTHGEDGYLYPHDEPYMLAYYVCRIFGDRALAEKLASSARARANIAHSREINLERLLEIYNDMAIAAQRQTTVNR